MTDAICVREGWTLQRLADELGYSLSMISNARASQSRMMPRMSMVEEIADLAGYTEKQIEELQIAVVRFKLNRTDGAIHEIMMRHIPKRSHRQVLLEIYPELLKRDDRQAARR